MKVLQQYDILAIKDIGFCHHSLQDSIGLLCHHLIQEHLDEKDVLHLSDIHPHWHFAKPTNIPEAISIGQPLLLNPRVVQGKGHSKGSQNKKSSTKQRPSEFEVVEKVEKR